MSVFLDLASTLHWGLVTAGVALLIRAAPWPPAWLARKPLACPVCVGLHSSLLVLATRWLSAHETPMILFSLDTAAQYFAHGAIAALVLRKLYPPDIELPL